MLLPARLVLRHTSAPPLPLGEEGVGEVRARWLGLGFFALTPVPSPKGRGEKVARCC